MPFCAFVSGVALQSQDLEQRRCFSQQLYHMIGTTECDV